VLCRSLFEPPTLAGVLCFSASFSLVMPDCFHFLLAYNLVSTLACPSNFQKIALNLVLPTVWVAALALVSVSAAALLLDFAVVEVVLMIVEIVPTDLVSVLAVVLVLFLVPALAFVLAFLVAFALALASVVVVDAVLAVVAAVEISPNDSASFPLTRAAPFAPLALALAVVVALALAAYLLLASAHAAVVPVRPS
jgi:hypothetical protein